MQSRECPQDKERSLYGIAFSFMKGISVMNKIIVEVYLPANGETYDIRVPDDMYIRDVADILGDLFSDVAKGMYCKSDINILCLRDKGESVPQDKTLNELNICNRTKLMFV
jgi:hypothetical protein